MAGPESKLAGQFDILLCIQEDTYGNYFLLAVGFFITLLGLTIPSF